MIAGHDGYGRPPASAAAAAVAAIQRIAAGGGRTSPLEALLCAVRPLEELTLQTC
jgi:hypothetical protein